MKQSGITRRIDELGRIVIPKEIRKNMHIKTGELLEIYLEKENKIILKKHDVISLKDEFLRSFINNLSLEIKSNVYLTNLNNIIFSNDEKQVGKKISNWLENEMSLNTNINNSKEFKLTEDKTIDSNYKVHRHNNHYSWYSYSMVDNILLHGYNRLSPIQKDRSNHCMLEIHYYYHYL